MKPKKTTRRMSRQKISKQQIGLKHGFRSGLEEAVAGDLTLQGVRFKFEEMVINYVKPERNSKYTPDFVLENGIIIETKGRFVTADRQKHLLIQQQHPDLDIRFVFSNSRTKISKRSNTTYADWCIKNNFQYADKIIPPAWLRETK